MMLERYADRPDIAQSARWVAALAFLSFLLLAFAQQGGVGSSLRPVPERPLPFDRSSVFGLDLTNRSSAGAVDWLNQAGRPEVALLIMPVDAEIVAAIASEQSATTGAAALQKLVEPVGSSPVALCLRRPLTAQSAEEVLATIVELIRDEFSESIAYLVSCDESAGNEWQDDLAKELGVRSASSQTLLPVTSGAPIDRTPLMEFQQLGVDNLRTFAGSRYIMPIIPTQRPLSEEEVELARGALRNAAQIALVGVQPIAGEPGGVGLTVAVPPLDDATLIEGFNSVRSAPIEWAGNWQSSVVGPLLYLRTEEQGLSLSTRFVGTSLYMNGLLSPEAGEVEIWIDRSPAPGVDVPDRVVQLEATQARDGIVQIADGLPAAQHTVTITTSGGEVAISGFFVAGRPEHDWVSALASVSLLLLSVGALTVANISRVRAIRRRTRPPRPSTDDTLFQWQPRS